MPQVLQLTPEFLDSLLGSQLHQWYTLLSNDRERECLSVKFRLWMEALGRRLILAPIHAAPEYVLEIGPGLGTWAMKLADHYRSAKVVGVDAAPIQPKFIPPNCQFILGDAEDSWNYKISFDVIHLSHAQTRVRDWCSVVHKTFKALKPGGWIELWIELPSGYTAIPQADGEFYKQLLVDAGFVKFQEKKIYLDSGSMRELLQDKGLDIRFPGIVCFAQRPLRSEGDLGK